jgi:hypothetical protein
MRTCEYFKLSAFKDEAVGGGAVEGECIGIENGAEAHGLSLADEVLVIALELLQGPWNAAAYVSYVYLSDFGGIPLSGVGDVETHLNLAVRVLFNCKVGVLEGAV